MSITSRISSMEEHVTNAYNGLQGLGADLTGIDKNIDNIASVLDDIYDDLPKVTGSGTSITLDDTRVGKIKSTLKGNTSQTGTPTPSSPIPVNVVSGDNTIDICGKNLFDKDNVRVGYRFGSDGEYYASTGYNATEYIGVQPSTLYSVSWSMVWDEVVCTYDINKNFVRRIQSGTNFTTSASEYYIRADVSNAHLSTAQIEKGSATTYEPYMGKSYPIYLGDIELCKIGTYQDYIYKDSGKWYKYGAIGKIVFTGTSSESYGVNVNWDEQTTNILHIFTNDVRNTWKIGQSGFLSNRFICTTQSGRDFAQEMITCHTTNETPYFFINYDNLSGVSSSSTPEEKGNAFKQWLSNNNVTLYYILANPTVTEITYQPLIDQLNLLEKAMSKDGQTNISQVNNDLPFIISASALKKWSE